MLVKQRRRIALPAELKNFSFYPVSPGSGLQPLLPSHCFGARFELFRMYQQPWSLMFGRVLDFAVLWIVVLGDTSREIRGLADVGFAR